MSKPLNTTLRALRWIVLCCLCSTATAASFDCRRTSSPIENLICLDYRLSDLDSELAAVYAAKRTLLGVAAELQSSQRKWLAIRNHCTSFVCARDAYIDRISILSAKSGEMYVAMRAPSLKRWDYVAPDGFTVGGLFVLHDQIMTLQSGSFRSKKKEWVLLDEGKSIAPEFTVRLPPYEPLLVFDRTIQLGMHGTVSNVGSTMCRTGVGELGLRVDNSMGHTNQQKPRVLVALVRQEWSSSEPSEDCFEVTLNHRRANFIGSTVFGDSLYWVDSTFSIRFDQQLWTQSALVGKKVFLMWGTDLHAMVAPHCKTYDRVCADKRFEKLFKDVSSFYK